MTTANKHMARSHRSYGITKSTLGSVERSSYNSNQSKQYAKDKARILMPFRKRLDALATKLSENVAKMFKKQDRG